MYLALGEREPAIADFEAGIAELEKHRESLPAGESRWGVLDAADELFGEAVSATLHDDPARAFAFAERERARSLSDGYPEDARRFDGTVLPAGVVVVEYVTLPQRLIVFTVNRQGYRVAERNIAREELASLLGQVNEDFQDGLVPRQSNAVMRAYELLIGPVLESVDGHREVVFVSDSATSAVPFAALTDRTTGRALIEDHVVSVAPSARMYARLRQRPRDVAPRSVLVVDSPINEAVEPLGFARAEAEAIRSHYREGDRLSGAAATPRAVAEAAPKYDVLHVAAHNVGSDDSAALVLTSTADQTGNVDAAAISRLRLPRTGVVVLAACGSARGPQRTAEGQLSVAYAFLQAGVPAVVATLWPISDRDSAAFFPKFHGYLAGGMAAAEALRRTQLESMRDAGSGGSNVWTAVQVAGY